MDFTFIFKALSKCVSTDRTRIHLKYVYATKKQLIATDGRIAGIFNYATNFEGPCLVDPKALTITGVNEKIYFPDIKKVTPKQSDKLDYKMITVEVPNIKSNNRGEPLTIRVQSNGELLFGAENKDTLTSLNLEYLQLFAGQLLNVWVKNKDSACIIAFDDKFVESDAFFILMPVNS